MNAQETNSAAMPEMLRKLMLLELLKNGFSNAEYVPASGQVRIPVDGNERPTHINAEGGILYPVEHRDIAMDVLRPIARRAKEIAAAWDNSRDMPVGDLPEFRMLAEYNNIVLAARDDTEHGRGLHFVTWEYNYERTGMYQGHYTEDYDYAKEDFAIRSGLISDKKLFTREQAAEIVATIEYRIENDGDVSYKKQDFLETISAKLYEAYPAPDRAGQASPDKKPSIGDKLREGKAKSDANRANNPAPAAKKHTKEID